MTYLVISEILFTVLHLLTLSITFTNRHQITCMAGMMISMALGMTSGLGLGTLLGVLYPGWVFECTIISMLTGSVVGALCGLMISVMAVLDGFLAGLMAGMMGIMLSSMISPEHFLSLLKIVAVILSTVIFILILLLAGEIHIHHRTSLIFTGLIFTFWFFIFHSEVPVPSQHNNMESPGHHAFKSIL